MLFSKEYVGYLAREVSKKLVASGLIETKAMPALSEKVHSAMLDELSLEDRINDEVRVILEAYSEEMQKSGANYQEMFRKVKTELVGAKSVVPIFRFWSGCTQLLKTCKPTSTAPSCMGSL